MTKLAGILVLNTTFASSAPAGAIGPISEEFELSDVDDFAVRHGVYVWSSSAGSGEYISKLRLSDVLKLTLLQLSETYGRRLVYLIPFTLYTLTQVGNALVPNTAALLIFRFLGGFFAAAPLTNSGCAFPKFLSLISTNITVIVARCWVICGHLKFAERLYRYFLLGRLLGLP